MKHKIFNLFIFAIVLVGFVTVNSDQIKAEIRAKPGAFERFKIDLPERIKVGIEHEFSIIAVDAFDNPINMPKDSNREFRLVTSGSAQLSITKFVANEITDKGLKIKLRNDRAEEFTVSLYEVNRLTPIFEKKIKSFPDSLSSLYFIVPPIVSIGTDFTVKIFGADKFGNRVCEDFNPKTLNLIFLGDGTPQIKGVTQSTDSCLVYVNLYSEKTGTFQIEASIIGTNIAAKSDPIFISNGEVAAFKVEAPAEAVLDEYFEVKVIAIDRFSNIVKNFEKTKERLIIESTGKGNLFPNEISSMNFLEGVAKFNMKYDRVEDIKLTVKSFRDGAIRGESSSISIKPPKIKRLEVISPDSIVVGQKFKVKIIAYNDFDRVMTNFSTYGRPVLLRSTGTGNLFPNRIPPSAFTDGVAIVEVVYDKAENFKIIATLEDSPIISEVPPVKEEKKQEKKTKKKRTSKRHDEKKAKSSIKESKSLELTNISLIETKNKATLVMTIPEIDKFGRYRPKTIKSEKRMTVELEISPAKNKLELPINLESEFIKEVSVNEKDSKLIIKIELKRPLNYRVFKKNNELLLEFRRN